MNKVILMGRLTRDPEVRYSQSSEPVAVARYTLAVNRRFKRKDEPEADFIPCVALGKRGEFAEKYFRKGQLVGVIGRLQVRSWDKDGERRYATEVIIEEQHFAESKKDSGEGKAAKENGQAPADGFYPIDESVEDDDLPF
ncbi:single-stranded DNA-binding protein [Anaerotignum faecicola]